MSRNKKVEALLEAWWQMEFCPANERADKLKAFHKLLDAAIGTQPFSRSDIQDALFGEYKEFKKQRKRDERTRVARSSLS